MQLYSGDSAIMLESMTQSVLITSPNLDAPGPSIEYVNKAFEEMTGWSREDVIGKTPRILQGPKTDFGIFTNLRDTLSKGKIWTGRTVNYKKDGSEFYMSWSITPIIKNNRIYKLLAVQEDITEKVKLENELYKSRKRELKKMKQIEQVNIKLASVAERQQKTLDLFIKYVPETIVNKALTEQNENIREGSQLEVALLFCDIRRFTYIAEKLSPKEVVRILNTYYTMMSDVVRMHNGVINQFTGDEIFVIFGAPEPINDPEISSLNCAIDMIKKLNEINKTLSNILPEKITVGIGLNYGSVIAGNLGSEDRLAYSITGDAVNTAKRIESLTRDLPDTILMTNSIFEKTKELVSTKPWGKVEIRGKEKKINVYQVI
jgi:PAS domain S-box-containing protein